MKIAVIGGGIAGLGAAYALKDQHQVVLYEKDSRLGGHANTVTVDYDGAAIDVDTGFIVYNHDNYPNLVGLFDSLGVATRQTDMSFACAGGGLEWSSNFPGGVFAQKRNLFNPTFLRMLSDIGRFNAHAQSDLIKADFQDLTLAGYLKVRGFTNHFRDRYLLPMGAAIWSTTEGRIGDFPAESFLRFFSNHGLLAFSQPKWRTVIGGSRRYVKRIGDVLGDRARIGTGVRSVTRLRSGKIEVTDRAGQAELFDKVIFASHPDQTLRMLRDTDPEERAFLGAIRYSANRAVLHRDPALMPRRRAAWGSWNYVTGGSAPYVTYWMNQLQGLDPARPLFVSLNGPEPDPALTFANFDYDHPQFDTAALAAQRQFQRIQGRGGVFHAGAWLGYGFHEDGLTSGVKAALALGGDVPWRFVDHRIGGVPRPLPLPAQMAAAG
ncbi:putative NAD/FAD-binding protein [Caulobacter ginsengisoli]|uniref:NAD/FAD-binding protein n=1 Tax=Caulobacter ginsengisoli TaxID=400775 RepID=A0ABU0IMD7_9CAUL|nr:FAD-dependent oxidoreductase [Caulobacter ginsengisoli]MDQ0463180.1 putative NAD/FAD-binding protein [Caulobacter ginsengisoli]